MKDEGEDVTTPSDEVPSTPIKTGQPPLDNLAEAPKGRAQSSGDPHEDARKTCPGGHTSFQERYQWKGKTIMVLIPQDSERGRPGNTPSPLDQSIVSGMLKPWEQLGYNTAGLIWITQAASTFPVNIPRAEVLGQILATSIVNEGRGSIGSNFLI